MHFTAAALAVVFGLPAYTGVLAAQSPRGNAPRVAHFVTERAKVTDPIRRDRIRRRGTVHADLTNQEILYFVNFTLGNPPQNLRASLDTGSSDLWVNIPSSSLCSKGDGACSQSGTYDPASSSTRKNLETLFSVRYADGTSASGNYATDDLSISGTKLKDFQFGIGSKSTSTEAVLGIGYPMLESQVQIAGGKPYENLPARLASSGAIASSAYSLWLNDLASNAGSVLFGGVDTAKYSGSLATLPIQPNAGVYNQIKITLTGVSFNGSSLQDNLAHAALLDAGSSLTYLPDTIITKLYAQVGAQFDSSNGMAYVPCSLATSPLAVAFNFSSPMISVGMDELVIDMAEEDGSGPQYPDGSKACLFGIMPAGAGTVVLGDTFLRSAYVVIDMASNQVSLGQTVFNATTSNIIEIAAPGQVPNATAVPSPITATLGVGIATPGATYQPQPSPTPSSKPNAADGGAKASSLWLLAPLTGLIFLLA
ncbi:aspartic-type endopeptidase [Microdochium bolleyi]|uniref:Probable aspartic-type endopeptidase OPSB n=1 Tax=Microdochium bolleyi TaxID=196109 RepID=A0A136JC75_9PEZI|nr:aspartic-type endopeptidase [Microdochium bolleyi]